MKRYNIENYQRHKDEVSAIQDCCDEISIEIFCRDTNKIVTHYLDLVEKIARTFNTSYLACGILCLEDLIQEGYIGLIAAAKKVDVDKIMLSSNPERMLVSFLSIRIKYAIRRGIDDKSKMIRFSERQIGKIRRGMHDDEVIELFFNNVLSSIHNSSFEQGEHSSIYVDINGNRKSYDVNFISQYIDSIMVKYLSKEDVKVLRWTYGVGDDCISYREISKRLGLTDYERKNNEYIQQLVSNAIHKLSKVVDRDLIISFFNDR